MRYLMTMLALLLLGVTPATAQDSIPLAWPVAPSGISYQVIVGGDLVDGVVVGGEVWSSHQRLDTALREATRYVAEDCWWSCGPLWVVPAPLRIEVRSAQPPQPVDLEPEPPPALSENVQWSVDLEGLTAWWPSVADVDTYRVRVWEQGAPGEWAPDPFQVSDTTAFVAWPEDRLPGWGQVCVRTERDSLSSEERCDSWSPPEPEPDPDPLHPAVPAIDDDPIVGLEGASIVTTPAELTITSLGETEGYDGQRVTVIHEYDGRQWIGVRLPDGREGLWGVQSLDGEGRATLDPVGPWRHVDSLAHIELTLTELDPPEQGAFAEESRLVGGVVEIADWADLLEPLTTWHLRVWVEMQQAGEPIGSPARPGFEGYRRNSWSGSP